MTQAAVCASDVSFAPSISTGKERDSESGNDYFGARYYASTMGRFLSPDWSAKIMPVPYAKLSDPQTLNLYAYVGNNPLTRTDPTGHYNTNCNSKDITQCSQEIQQFETNRNLNLQSKDSKVRASAAAYGGFNDGNKVNVKFDPNAKVGVTKQDVTGGKPLDSVTVPLPSNAGKDLVAHEGSHVGDFNSVMSGSASPTRFQGEIKAYQTQAGTLMDNYPVGTVGSPAMMYFVDQGASMYLMQPFDPIARGINEDAIKGFLADSPTYGLSENNQGGYEFVKP